MHRLKDRKAPDCDGIVSDLLKQMSENPKGRLFNIIKVMYESGQVPYHSKYAAMAAAILMLH